MSNENMNQIETTDVEFEQIAAAEQTMTDESISAEDREIMEMIAADEAAQQNPPVDADEVPATTEETAADEPDPTPAEIVAAEIAPAAPVTTDVLMEMLRAQAATIERLTIMAEGALAKKSGGSGSKARPNTTYKLLKRPVAWAKTPQVAQLQRIIFDNPEKLTSIPEPKLFELLEDAKKDGRLRTTQPAARIFQYYRSALVGGDYIQQL